MPFYNTNKESFEEASASSLKAANQSHAILRLLEMAKTPMSPSMVYKALNQEWPITSIRRAMTNLTDDGKIVKTQKTTKGIYGKKEHLWALPEKPQSAKQVALFDF
nr:uncharacterized protein [uncultured Mediterranean phage uvMED]